MLRRSQVRLKLNVDSDVSNEWMGTEALVLVAGMFGEIHSAHTKYRVLVGDMYQDVDSISTKCRGLLAALFWSIHKIYASCMVSVSDLFVLNTRRYTSGYVCGFVCVHFRTKL